MRFLCALLVTAGLFILLGIKPKDVFGKLLRPLEKWREKRKRINSLTGKQPGFIERQLSAMRQMLDASGMGGKESHYKWLAIVLATLGLLIGLTMDNPLVAFVLAIGGALVPMAVIRIRTGDYTRQLFASLESGMGTVTNAYLQSPDLIGVVKDSIHLLPAPLDSLFRRFLSETQFIDANTVKAISSMREAIDNRYWKDWCGVLIQCQADRQLRFALPGIVERLGEMRRVQMEADTSIRKQMGDYLLTVLIVLGSIPLMAFMMPDWYDMLTESLAGKITLAVMLLAVLATSLWVSRINLPVVLGGDKS